MIDIIPAIDVMDGKCVRLYQGDFAQKKIYSDDPLDTAKGFEAAGISRLHLVDLDGARQGKPVNLSVLETIAGNSALEIDFGGGIRTESDLARVFGAGAAMANIGSLAAREPKTAVSWAEQFGSDRILIGADVRDGMVAVNGWTEVTGITLATLLNRFTAANIVNVFVTDISRDGAMGGPAVELYGHLIESFPNLRLIASGGVRDLADIEELERVGCSGVIVGKAIYEGLITMEEIANYAR